MDNPQRKAEQHKFLPAETDRSIMLKQVVLDELGIDVMEATRLREVVDARKIFAYILATYHNYGCKQISRILGMNHATMLYYVKDCVTLILFEAHMKDAYERVLEAYKRRVSGSEISTFTRLELEHEVERLREVNRELKFRLAQEIKRRIEGGQ